MADEALGRSGGPRHADAVALGEADETWPKIVNDAANNALKEIYAPVELSGRSKSLRCRSTRHSVDTIDLDQFNIVPKLATPMLRKLGAGWAPSASFRRVRPGLSVRMRVLHGHGFFWRLDSISHEQECRGRVVVTESAG